MLLVGGYVCLQMTNVGNNEVDSTFHCLGLGSSVVDLDLLISLHLVLARRVIGNQ